MYVGARDAGRGQRAVEEIGAGARLLILDVNDPDGIGKAATQVDHLDVPVNNAGVALSLAPPAETEVEEFRRTYETNVFGVVTVTNAFLPALRRSPRPRIVNISSGTASLTWSTNPNPQFTPGSGSAAAYRSSKAALNALTLYLRPDAGRGWLQGQRARPQRAGHRSHPSGRRSRRRPGRGRAGCPPPGSAPGRRPHRQLLLLGRNARALVSPPACGSAARGAFTPRGAATVDQVEAAEDAARTDSSAHGRSAAAYRRGRRRQRRPARPGRRTPALRGGCPPQTNDTVPRGRAGRRVHGRRFVRWSQRWVVHVATGSSPPPRRSRAAWHGH